MSWSFQNPCWNCKRKDDGCKDADKIQESITAIHTSNDGSHQGSGTVALVCGKCVSKI